MSAKYNIFFGYSASAMMILEILRIRKDSPMIYMERVNDALCSLFGQKICWPSDDTRAAVYPFDRTEFGFDKCFIPLFEQPILFQKLRKLRLLTENLSLIEDLSIIFKLR